MVKALDDAHFRHFASTLEQAIERYGEMDEGQLLARQRNQVETLVALEKEFRQTLIKHPWGPGVYKAFIRFIRDEKRSILAARPYFRERQGVFTKKISKALNRRADRSLYKFHFNFQFILFTIHCFKWPKGGKIVKLAGKIRALRTELVEMNMPLAISRARIFWSRTPKAQLSYMDLVQISSEGLMSAIDKFCLPYSKVFRAVAIGRMLGNFIEQYSETLIHFYPVDKRKIYRANKLMRWFGENVDWERLADGVNKDVDPAHRTNAEDLQGLMAAASYVSADTTVTSNDGSQEQVENSRLIDLYIADEDQQPDVLFEKADAYRAMSSAIDQLSLVEKKLLRMRGVSL